MMQQHKARAQLSWPQRGINKTVPMTAPIRLSDEMAWYRAARKVLPEAPEVTPTSRWQVRETIVSTCTIIFSLWDTRTHERCAVVVDRNGKTYQA